MMRTISQALRDLLACVLIIATSLAVVVVTGVALYVLCVEMLASMAW